MKAREKKSREKFVRVEAIFNENQKSQELELRVSAFATKLLKAN